MPWDPTVYDRFKHERSAPFADLLALIRVRDGMRVLDLGCGTGELTARLAGHLPGSDVLGIDSSPTMIARAWARVQPGLRFERTPLERVTGQWDLVFSHAALQWVPRHDALLPFLLNLVAPGGQFAAVIPSDHTITARELLRETAREEPFAAAFDGWVRKVQLLPLEQYAELLLSHGATALTVLEKLYPVVLPDTDALLDWYRGTALVPYLERLPEALQAQFIARCRERLHARWPTGPVLYPGRRIILHAHFGEEASP